MKIKNTTIFSKGQCIKVIQDSTGVMVGGHIDSGEEEYTALIREISEEAGITASDEKIDFIGQIVENIVEDTFIDNEICRVYRYTPDFDEKFNPNKEVARIVRIEEKSIKNVYLEYRKQL